MLFTEFVSQMFCSASGIVTPQLPGKWKLCVCGRGGVWVWVCVCMCKKTIIIELKG